MSFDQIQPGRVLTAAALIFVIGVMLSFAVQFGYIMTRMLDAMGELNPNATRAEQQELLQDEIDVLLQETQDGSSTMRTLSLIQWALTAVAAFFVARRTARANATTPEEGVGYGVLIGAGAMLLYGVCICTAPTEMTIKLIFFVILFVATVLGGQLGSQSPRPKGKPEPMRPRGGQQPVRAPAGSGSAETYYTMGVQAALSGRRDEAREHFTQVLQLQPRHVAAWLQLANLAETPEQAWNYIQQARSIDANDPAVLRAVDVIWPQVAAGAQRGAPHLAPPYKGGASDEVEIPVSTLPREREEPPGLEHLDALFDEADTPILPVTRDATDDSAEDDERRSPPPGEPPPSES